MTDEIRKQIDGLNAYSHSIKLDYGGTYTCEFIMKSDVMMLVEDLLRWRDMSETPDMFGNYICKIKSGAIQVLYFGDVGFEYTYPDYISKWKSII